MLRKILKGKMKRSHTVSSSAHILEQLLYEQLGIYVIWNHKYFSDIKYPVLKNTKPCKILLPVFIKPANDYVRSSPSVF